jgi:Protein of unknown function (DUF4013)
MNLGKAFTFAFEDKDWLKKLGIAGLVMLIPLIGQLTVSGWALETTRRVIQHEPEELGDWGAFGDYLVKGLKIFVIGIVYALPIILISICANLPLMFMGNGDNQSTTSILSLLSTCVSCLAAIYGIALWFLIPAALANFVVSGELGAAFRFSDVFALVRAAPGAYVLALIGGFVAAVLAGLGVILCVIGVIFTIAWAYTIQGHLWGQAYNEAIAKKGM